MRKLLLLLVLLWPAWASAQTCPSGTRPLPWGVTRDGTTDLRREIFCQDPLGNIYSNLLVQNGMIYAPAWTGNPTTAIHQACLQGGMNALVVAPFGMAIGDPSPFTDAGCIVLDERSGTHRIFSSDGAELVEVSAYGPGVAEDARAYQLRIHSEIQPSPAPLDGYPLGHDMGVQTGGGPADIHLRNRKLISKSVTNAPGSGACVNITLAAPATGDAWDIQTDHTTLFAPAGNLLWLEPGLANAEALSYNAAPGAGQWNINSPTTFRVCPNGVHNQPYFASQQGSVFLEAPTAVVGCSANCASAQGKDLVIIDSASHSPVLRLPYDAGAAWPGGSIRYSNALTGYNQDAKIRNYDAAKKTTIQDSTGATIIDFPDPVAGVQTFDFASPLKVSVGGRFRFAFANETASLGDAQFLWMDNTSSFCGGGGGEACSGGTLGILSRTSTAAAHIIFGTGNGAPAERMRIEDAGVDIGSGGTPIAKHLSATAVRDFASAAANTCSADLTITVTGSALGDTTTIGVPNASVNAGSVFWGWVSAANTVTIRHCNVSAAANDPASGTFRADVWKH